MVEINHWKKDNQHQQHQHQVSRKPGQVQISKLANRCGELWNGLHPTLCLPSAAPETLSSIRNAAGRTLPVTPRA
jgi:hypothetical protein